MTSAAADSNLLLVAGCRQTSHASRTQRKLPLRCSGFHCSIQHARAISTLHVLHLPEGGRYRGLSQPRRTCAHAADHQRQRRHLVRDFTFTLSSMSHIRIYLTVKGENRIYKAVLSDRGTPKEKRASSERHFCSKCSAMLWLWDETWCAAKPLYVY